MIALPSLLRKVGVLAINRRNAQFVLKYNPRRLYPLVDDKLKTKQLALSRAIAAPELYGVIEVEGQVKGIQGILQGLDDFVIKPARGSGGNGILVVAQRLDATFRGTDGSIITFEDITYHIFNILSGLYSLGGQRDRAMIEYRVKFHPAFSHIVYQGVPDIRIIVFLGIPVMSMIRLPTRMSRGKANLHQGAIGVGINMASGTTLSGVWRNEVAEKHPDTGNTLTGLAIPEWQRLLEIATACYDITGLGYFGVDMVIDAEKGPMILELNARPGLNIQIANQAGLIPRLRLVEELDVKPLAIEDRTAFAQANFGVSTEAG